MNEAPIQGVGNSSNAAILSGDIPLDVPEINKQVAQGLINDRFTSDLAL
jgi:hypothetical protein